ncbi:ectoine synthase [Marinomonas sp. 2405UD68-3]|uniref:ectoine synthase n=1 Tax=Marinomonas sp. 2405UD68-3 TaxID=3391835 RepID=UPI0039C8C20B
MICKNKAAGWLLFYLQSSRSLLEYKNHLEACYCISGKGQVLEENGAVHEIEVGTVYVLDKSDKHVLINASEEDFVLVSVFNPLLKGTEVHSLDGSVSSAY